MASNLIKMIPKVIQDTITHSRLDTHTILKIFYIICWNNLLKPEDFNLIEINFLSEAKVFVSDSLKATIEKDPNEKIDTLIDFFKTSIERLEGILSRLNEFIKLQNIQSNSKISEIVKCLCNFLNVSITYNLSDRKYEQLPDGSEAIISLINNSEQFSLFECIPKEISYIYIASSSIQEKNPSESNQSDGCSDDLNNATQLTSRPGSSDDKRTPKIIFHRFSHSFSETSPSSNFENSETINNYDKKIGNVFEANSLITNKFEEILF